MELILYKNFVKKSNSTKRPSGGDVHNVRLKEDTSIQNPVFLIDGVDFAVNYCYLPSIGRYYFIDDIVVGNSRVVELHCSSDVLATYKTQIGDYTAYVERASSRFDSLINDNAISMRQAWVQKNKTKTNVGVFSTTGCFLLRTIASDSNSVTGLNTYCLTKGQMSTFLNQAFNVGNYGDLITEAFGQVIKAVFNPFDYIVSVAWIPFEATQFAGTNAVSQIKLGWWSPENARGYIVSHESFGSVTQVNKPPAYYGDFRDYNPQFTKATIWLNGVGLIDLDPRELNPNSNLYVMYFIDCATGQANCYLRSGASQEDSISIASYPATLCAPVQLSQSSLNIEGVASNMLATAGSITSGNVPSASISGINTVLDLVRPTTNLIGSQGNRASITAYTDIYIERVHYGSKDFPTTVAGRPLCENVKLNTLSGYIQCGKASIDLPSLGGDKDSVNNFLNNGFYFE